MESRPRSRARVVVVGHVARLSGGEIALLRLVPGLLTEVDVTVVLAEEGPLVAALRSRGAEVVVLPMAAAVRDRRKDSGLGLVPVLRTLAYVWRLRALLRSLSADVVHTNTLKAAFYGGCAGRLARVPVVWHVRDRIAVDYLPRGMVAAVRLLARVLPTAVVVNSRATAQTLPRRAVVVPDCVENVLDRARAAGAGPLVFGVVGRLAPWKGQHVFLAAFAAAFAGTEHRARLVGAALFGEEAYATRLQELAESLGIGAQVDLRGFRDDVEAEYDALDVLVHCSTIPEPFGQVVIEGMARGLPVVAAAAGGPAEVVTDGVDGVLVPPDDVGALAGALRRLADDQELRNRLGAAALATAAGYLPARTARGVLDVYADLGVTT